MVTIIKSSIYWSGYAVALASAMAISAGVGFVLAWVVHLPAGALM